MEKDYVLITAARNEEAYIEKILRCVIAQVLLPKIWVIISDGSTDRTNVIVSKYSDKYNFIKLIKLPREGNRNFGCKVNAIKVGLAHLSYFHYDFIGNIDADVSFTQNYFENLIKEFNKDQRLGLAGGVLYDFYNHKLQKRIHYTKSVPGAIQFFRRKCFEDIGGYQDLKTGGVDTVAEVMARMKGWKTKTIFNLQALHHRRDGTEERNHLVSMFFAGYRDYLFGHHPIFQVLKCVRRLTEFPYGLSSIMRFYGYLFGAFSLLHKDRPVSKEFINYLRKEQIDRIKEIIKIDFNISKLIEWIRT